VDIGVLDVAQNPVGSQQQGVTGLSGKLGKIGRTVVFGAERTGDDVLRG
jgi:hypothetical protein